MLQITGIAQTFWELGVGTVPVYRWKSTKQVVSRIIAKAPFTSMVLQQFDWQRTWCLIKYCKKDSNVTHIKKKLKWVSIVLIVNIAVPEHKREVRVYDPTDMNARVMEQD